MEEGKLIERMVGMLLKFDAELKISRVLRECGEMDCSSTQAEASFHLARFWLEECLDKHDRCPKFDDFLPTRVSDVGRVDDSEEPHLVVTEELTAEHKKQPYVALSHCWEKKRFLTTAADRFVKHRGRIPMQDLPASFQDAVIVVRRLGFRYLWIDSLCII